MKHTLRKITKLSVICLVLTFIGCQNDDAITQEEKSFKFKSSTERISYKRIKKGDLPNAAIVNDELLRLKGSIDDKLFIYDEIILYTGYEEKHTLTFLTYRTDRKSNEIENIVLESRGDGRYNSYLFRYNLTADELQNLDRMPAETIRSRTEIVSFVAGNGGGLINISCFEAVQNYVGAWECEAGNPHGPGHPDCTVGGSTWSIQPTTLSWVYVGCEDGGGSGGSGGGSGGSGGAGGGTGGGGSGDDSGGSSGGGTGNNDPGSGDIGEEQEPDYSLVEGSTIITQPIVFEPEILQILLDDSFTENDCLMGVYEELGGSPTFQGYLQNFDGDFSVAHLKFTVGIDSNSPDANAITYGPNNYIIEIMFNPNKLNRPKTDIARTFIHEIIHAEIYRKLLSIANSPNGTGVQFDSETIEDLKDNFPGLYDYYTRYYFNVPEGQELTDADHELMAQHYRDIIEDALLEYDTLLTPEQAEALAWIGLMGEGGINPSTILPEQPTVAWSNKPLAYRTSVWNTYNNYKNSNPPCQS